MKTTGIYKITNPEGKIYIGQANDIKRRWYFHKSLKNKTFTKLHHSLTKHGVDTHTFEVIEECSREALNERERYWQDHYNAMYEGLNGKLTNTKDKKGVMSPESIAKIKAAAQFKHMDVVYAIYSMKNKHVIVKDVMLAKVLGCSLTTIEKLLRNNEFASWSKKVANKSTRKYLKERNEYVDFMIAKNKQYKSLKRELKAAKCIDIMAGTNHLEKVKSALDRFIKGSTDHYANRYDKWYAAKMLEFDSQY